MEVAEKTGKNPNCSKLNGYILEIKHLDLPRDNLTSFNLDRVIN